MSNMLLGWTLPQWAEAAAWYERAHKSLPLRDITGAIELQHSWKSCRIDEPGDRRIAEVPRDMQWAWAAPMLEIAWSYVAKTLRTFHA